MLKIESNLKINGRHWGLAFTDGIAYTANVALAAKLLLKGYVVTDEQPDQQVAGPMITGQGLSPTPAAPAQADTIQTAEHPEQPVSSLGNSVSTSSVSESEVTSKPPKPKPTKPRKKAVNANAADESGV